MKVLEQIDTAATAAIKGAVCERNRVAAGNLGLGNKIKVDIVNCYTDGLNSEG